MKKTIITIVALISIISCQNNSNNPMDLSNNEKLTRFFSPDEIEAMESIISYFDKMVVPGVTDYNSVYQKYFDEMAKAESYDDLLSKIDLKSKDAGLLIKNLKKNGVFNEIWTELPNKLNDNKSLDINWNGKYFQFLKSMSSEYSFLKNYVSSVESVGGINVVNKAGMLKIYYKEVDFNKEIIRLIWAVHYITVLSNINRS